MKRTLIKMTGMRILESTIRRFLWYIIKELLSGIDSLCFVIYLELKMISFLLRLKILVVLVELLWILAPKAGAATLVTEPQVKIGMTNILGRSLGPALHQEFFGGIQSLY